jgi:hypothetical protein
MKNILVLALFAVSSLAAQAQVDVVIREGTYTLNSDPLKISPDNIIENPD